MKRSEMVEIIKDYLDLCKNDHTNEEKAEYILGCCETWGMLPPNNPNIEHPEQWGMEHRWEDEKK